MGFPVLAMGGRQEASCVRVSAENSDRVNPAASQASAARMPGPPALVTMADAAPRRQRLRVQAGPPGRTSRRACRRESRPIDETRHRRRRRWRRAPRYGCRRRACPRACARTSPRRSAWLRDSACQSRKTARVAERFQVEQDDVRRRIAFPVFEQVVARRRRPCFPTLTKVDRPSVAPAASDRIAMPSAPLCDSRPMLPAGGKTGENDAFRRTAGVVFSSPMQLGPTIRMP